MSCVVFSLSCTEGWPHCELSLFIQFSRFIVVLSVTLFFIFLSLWFLKNSFELSFFQAVVPHDLTNMLWLSDLSA